jgi:hypothetical protein
MATRGRVQNGVVVLDNGVCLPEGQEVTVLASDTVPASPLMESSRPHSVLDVPTVSVGAVLRPLTADGVHLLSPSLHPRIHPSTFLPIALPRTVCARGAPSGTP